MESRSDLPLNKPLREVSQFEQGLKSRILRLSEEPPEASESFEQSAANLRASMRVDTGVLLKKEFRRYQKKHRPITMETIDKYEKQESNAILNCGRKKTDMLKGYQPGEVLECLENSLLHKL
jgi:hypothetical protein